MNPIIAQLHEKLNALRAEWEGLSERRRAALLAGSRDALLDAEVRKIQIPYEAVKACNLAVHALLAELEAEARALETDSKPKCAPSGSGYALCRSGTCAFATLGIKPRFTPSLGARPICCPPRPNRACR
jgi:hypothetical protein